MANEPGDDAAKGDVGYRRPPRRHQFNKGKSGNPKGRPKGSRNFATDVKQMLSMPVPLARERGRKSISTQQAGLLRLREKALKGDPKALDRLLELARQHNGEVAAATDTDPLAPDDQAIIDAFLVRQRGDATTTSSADAASSSGKAPEEK
jgi:hypothetical protein